MASAVHSFTLAKPLEWLEQRSALVEYGLGRFVDGHDRITIEGLLVLLAITRFFETTAHTLLGDVRAHLQLNQEQGFEAVVL